MQVAGSRRGRATARMSAVDSMLAEVRALADRGDHQTIVARYGRLDDTPEDETWNSTELLFEIGRAFGMLGDEDKLERYLLRCAELAPRRAAVFHCAIGWYFQRKKKWTKALRWYDRALASFPTYHLCLFRRGYCLEKLHRPREAVEALARARSIWEEASSDQRQRGRGVQVQVLFHLSRALRDLGEFEQAADVLMVCRDLDANTTPPAIQPEHVLACQGELELRRGDLDAALRAFDAARALDPESSYIWERIGRVHELRRETQTAQEAYRHAASLPRGAFALFALGRFHTNVTGDLPAAAGALVRRSRPSAERRAAGSPRARPAAARVRPPAARRWCRSSARWRAAVKEALPRGSGSLPTSRSDWDAWTTPHAICDQLAALAPDDAAVAARVAALEGAPRRHAAAARSRRCRRGSPYSPRPSRARPDATV